MMEHRHGRRPNAAALIDTLDGSEPAKAKLKMIFETLAGDRTIPDAVAEVAIGESRFHVVRLQALQAAVTALEPKPMGRRPQPRPVESDSLEKLAEQVRDLQRQLLAVGLDRDLAKLGPTAIEEKPASKKA